LEIEAILKKKTSVEKGADERGPEQVQKSLGSHFQDDELLRNDRREQVHQFIVIDWGYLVNCCYYHLTWLLILKVTTTSSRCENRRLWKQASTAQQLRCWTAALDILLWHGSYSRRSSRDSDSIPPGWAPEDAASRHVGGGW
jgi:hypothetical protein